MTACLTAEIVAALRTTSPFKYLTLAVGSATPILWSALNETLLMMRMPIHHTKLGKAAPKRAVYEAATQRGLALLACFAAGNGTKQAIVSSGGGVVRRISFQPRPFGVNWTAEHALSPDHVRDAMRDDRLGVNLGDFLHLASKTVHVALRREAWELPDLTATFTFTRSPVGSSLVIREASRTSHVALL